VVATKQILPRTEVTYSSAIGNTNERKIRLGYRLNDNFLLESTNESLGSTSIGVKYRLMLE
jgi:autotransporter translocation and assembly factor TamB